MSEQAILAAARAAMVAAFPAARDWSDDPAAIKPDKLGAFSVTVERNGATPAAMGSPLSEVSLTVGVDLFSEFGAYDAGREVATRDGHLAAAAIMAAPDFVRLTDFVVNSALSVDLAQAEKRLARVSVALTVISTF